MERAHKATRPVWALHSADVIVNLGVAIFFSAAATTLFTVWIRAKLAPQVASWKISDTEAALVLDVITTTLLALFGACMIPIYKKITTRHYPGTYVYCFEQIQSVLDSEGKPSEKVVFTVVGCFVLEVLADGGLSAKGNAWEWNDGLQFNELQIGWKSKHVGTTKANTNSTTCFIIFEVNDEDKYKRPYTQGLIDFEMRPRAKGIVAEQTVYRGHIHGIDPKNGTIPFYAYAYAERIGKVLGDTEIMDALRDHGVGLIRRLRQRRGGQ